MPLRLSKTYAAFKASGASDLQAQEAAEELATYENRLADIESDLKTIKRDLSETKWLVRILVGFLLVWVTQVFCSLVVESNTIQLRNGYGTKQRRTPTPPPGAPQGWAASSGALPPPEGQAAQGPALERSAAGTGRSPG